MPPPTSDSTARSPSRWCARPAGIRSRGSASGARRGPPPACRTPTCASCTTSARRTGSSSSRWSCSRASRSSTRLARGPDSAGRERRHHARDALGTRRDPRAGARASRPEAVEHLSHRARREAARLRPGPRRRGGRRRDTRRHHDGRNRHGNPALHVARADHGRSARRAIRSVRGRGHPLRAPGGRSAVPGEDDGSSLPRRSCTSQLPSVGGSPALAAIDRIIHRATAKKPTDRYPQAATMAQDLRAALRLADSGETPTARRMTRLVVLPFRMLRPDPEIDFLSFSLADAITASLGSLESLVVCSSLAAARFKADAPDLSALASELDVDAAVTGTLLRAGAQVRVATQLVEARGGRLLWSQTAQVTLNDVFQLQDDLTRQIVESLSLPLSAREQRMLSHDAPANARVLRVLPARERARLGSDELDDRARSLPAGGPGRSDVCARVGAARAAAPPDRQAWRRRQRGPDARRSRAAARTRVESGPAAGSQPAPRRWISIAAAPAMP